MARAIVTRTEQKPPPIETVTLELSYAEAKDLLNVIGSASRTDLGALRIDNPGVYDVMGCLKEAGI